MGVVWGMHRVAQAFSPRRICEALSSVRSAIFVAPGVSRGLEMNKRIKAPSGAAYYPAGNISLLTELWKFLFDVNPGLTPWATNMPLLTEPLL